MIRKESKAWLRVAEHLEETGCNERGICHVLGRMREDEEVSVALWDRMDVRLYNTFPSQDRLGVIGFTTGYFWPRGQIEERLLACGLLSSLAAGEGK